MPGTPDTRSTGKLEVALGYAALGWPLVPGATWCDGHFADPANGQPVTSPFLRRVEQATANPDLVRAWWSSDGIDVPNVLTVTGPRLGAVSVHESLVEAVIAHSWFTTRPTPVLAIPEMPFAHFLVRPPLPMAPLNDEARVVPDGTTLPLPPSALGGTAVSWLVSPDEAGNVLMRADELADLIRSFERKTA